MTERGERGEPIAEDDCLSCTLTLQSEGAAMGYPLSPIPANLFMEEFEEAIDTTKMKPYCKNRMVVLTTKWLPRLQSSEDQNIVPEPQCCL